MDVSAALSSLSTQDRPRADLDRGCLCGTRCTNCGAPSWPARSVCHRCGSAVIDSVCFESTGSLLTYTTVWVPRPGLTVPYTLGQVYVDDDGPLVFGHIRGLAEGVKVPYRVRLRLAEDRDDIPWYWFEPEGEADG